MQYQENAIFASIISIRNGGHIGVPSAEELSMSFSRSIRFLSTRFCFRFLFDLIEDSRLRQPHDLKSLEIDYHRPLRLYAPIHIGLLHIPMHHLSLTNLLKRAKHVVEGCESGFSIRSSL